MRPRLEIVQDLRYSICNIAGEPSNGALDVIASNQRLILEVLLDIRDSMENNAKKGR